jgi:molybdenum cofactor biosynthesis protein B
MSVDDLRQPPAVTVRCAVLTVSDTRTADTDTGGQAIQDLLTTARHLVVDRRIVRDDPGEVSRTIAGWARTGDIRVIIATGGTGISSRDTTPDAVRSLFSKELIGFGELFRMLSYQDIGPAAMLSRATAGVIESTAVFLLPGSVAAVRLAMTALIVPQLGHIARELEK